MSSLMLTTPNTPPGLQAAPVDPEAGVDTGSVLSAEALTFVAELVRQFRDPIAELLERRERRRGAIAAGGPLGFLPETAPIRADREWRVAPIPADLLRRTVEITGPVDAKMMINALNSGADVFMADFEDATSPTWSNILRGYQNVRAAVRRSLEFDDPSSGKQYRLTERSATLLVRPRGLHLEERHLTVDGRRVPAALADFGFVFFHNAAEQVARGSGPYFYLPKLESHREARLWNDVFVAAQTLLGLPRGTIRATVLIETLPAAFEMEEILYELREHASGLNCGRWDYIFSCIKTRRHDPHAVFPDRSAVTMSQPNMAAYVDLAIATCHRRGAYCMGGMSAFIPAKDPEANVHAFGQVRLDKEREVTQGHDGTWVAHPALIPIAREAFEKHMTTPNQLDRISESSVTASDLLAVPRASRTQDGFRRNVRVGVQYIEAWLRGIGAVPLYNLMEDAATAEISRTQVWQWITHAAALNDGRVPTIEWLQQVLNEELDVVRAEVGESRFASGRFAEASEIFFDVATSNPLREFFTTAAYEYI